ncbi:sugar kinase [Paludifilum halophilum]|uniref:sugar kinase n=1 Tax=Paludifilum halophilum TaxID=1642702 RepID=UPI001F0A6D46|nr:sugar kinase [Paludifilum halophilum]
MTLGETMLAFSPVQDGPLDTVHGFEKKLAGAESNVAIALSRLGYRTAWVSRLGKDPFGRWIYKTLRGEGVDVSGVTFDPIRPTGLYIKERLGGKQTRIYYYRSGSAASAMDQGLVDLPAFSEAAILFVTGITPALGSSCKKAVFAALDKAREQGMKVVFDPNYRGKLWSRKEAAPVFRQIASRSHLVLPGLAEGELMTGATDPESVAENLRSLGARQVVVKLGPRGAYYQTEQKDGYVPGFQVSQEVDEVGAGDAFAAGCLSGLLDGLDPDSAVKRACALGALAVTVKGDYESLPDREELHCFLQGETGTQR